MSPTWALGCLCAFSFAALTVFYDCHLALKTYLKRVPISIFRSKEACAVSFCAGLIALTAFRFTNGKGDSAIDAILTLKQPQDILRGICVGLTVLVLIRSKLTTVRGSELGGELLYSAARSWVVERVNQNWSIYKRCFNNQNLAHAVTIQDYEALIVDQIKEAIKVNEEDYRTFVETQIKNVTSGRPNTPFDSGQNEWRRYYRTLTNLALDFAGQHMFKSWDGFSLKF